MPFIAVEPHDAQVGAVDVGPPGVVGLRPAEPGNAVLRWPVTQPTGVEGRLVGVVTTAVATAAVGSVETAPRRRSRSGRLAAGPGQQRPQRRGVDRGAGRVAGASGARPDGGQQPGRQSARRGRGGLDGGLGLGGRRRGDRRGQTALQAGRITSAATGADRGGRGARVGAGARRRRQPAAARDRAAATGGETAGAGAAVRRLRGSRLGAGVRRQVSRDRDGCGGGRRGGAASAAAGVVARGGARAARGPRSAPRAPRRIGGRGRVDGAGVGAATGGLRSAAVAVEAIGPRHPGGHRRRPIPNATANAPIRPIWVAARSAELIELHSCG